MTVFRLGMATGLLFRTGLNCRYEVITAVKDRVSPGTVPGVARG
ncbi:MAG: hypothetical protein ACP5JB_00600 [candidate division WOR-3 bacterium]